MVRTTCERCGDVQFPVEGARLTVPGPTADPRKGLEFTCPRCSTLQRQPVNERGAMLLVRAGVEVTAHADPPVDPRL